MHIRPACASVARVYGWSLPEESASNDRVDSCCSAIGVSRLCRNRQTWGSLVRRPRIMPALLCPDRARSPLRLHRENVTRCPVDLRLHLTKRIPKNAAPTAYRWLEVATSLRNIPIRWRDRAFRDRSWQQRVASLALYDDYGTSRRYRSGTSFANEAPRYMIRDRDRIYGTVVTRRLRAMGIRDKPTAPFDPARERRSYDCLGRGASASHPEILRPLLQRSQNASVFEQGCARLSLGTAHRCHSFTRHPWRTSSPL